MSTRHSPISAIRARSLTIAIILLAVFVVSGCGGAAATRSPSPSGSAPLVALPADQANHPGAANEWWYLVGHLSDGTRTFGYETTIFRFSHLH
ncbi:MAG: lipocalin-like domain-containing protein, partial [Chloroflexota bacterium]